MDLVIDNAYTKIENATSAEIGVIDELLALKQPGYFFSPAFKSGRWDGKVRFLDKRGLVFPTGLLDKVLDALKAVGYGKPNLIDERSLLNVKVPKEITLEEPDAEGGVITLRDYQHEAVRLVFEKKRGIVNVATNGGKTECASGVIKLLLPKLKRGERILFVTHNIEIFTQSAKRIARRLGLDEDEIGMVGGGKWVEKPITMVMVPTLSKHTKKPVSVLPDSAYKKEFKSIRFLIEFIGKHIKKSEPDNRDIMINAIQVLEDVSGKKRDQLAIDILSEIVSSCKTSTACFKQFEKLRKDLKAFEEKKLKGLNKNYERAMDLLKSAVCFIADEAHHSSSTTWYDNLMLCENAIYRIGLTGTVDEKNEIGVFRLYSVTGEILTKISNEFLIERGISAKPTIYMSSISQPDIKALDFQPAYDYGIVNNTYRNNLIAEQVRQSYIGGMGCLVIVNRMKHGENIKKLLDELNVPNEFTHGSFDNREGVLKDMKEGRLKVLIATTIMDEGVDISGINALFMAAGGKSFRQVLQRIGRGLRVKADGSGLAVYDYLDLTNKYLTKHTQERFDYYRAEKFEVVKL